MNKRQLPIDLSDLEDAFVSSSDGMHYYLDLETGQVALVTDDSRSELEAIYDEIYGEGDEPRGDFEAALARRGLPEWLQGMVREADQVEQGYGSRFIAVPGSDTHEDYRDMERFIDTVRDPRLHNRLSYAIQGRGAFRRFKDTLLDHPAERERWFAFSTARERERILEWLESEGIEVIASDKG
jgi:hypothetical protein